MESLKDKVIGSWFGMAVGDAMGLAVKGLKPETIQQCFGPMDGYKDVRPFIGKGVKQFRMQGLYGTLIQSALAVCDSLLKNKKSGTGAIADRLQQLAAGGLENSFGVYRHPESCFRKAVESLSHRQAGLPAEQNSASCGFASMAVPVALFHQKESSRMLEQCVDTCLLMSRHPWEATGAALTAYLVARFLSIEPDPEKDRPLGKEALDLVRDAAQFCEQAESIHKKRVPEWWDENLPANGRALSLTLHQMPDRLDMPLDELLAWICKNASAYVQQNVAHPSQGHALTLLPLSLVMILKTGNDFQSMMTASLNRGREANKVGALVGAWAGALYGYSSIPEPWKTGLVNARDLKARGEALFFRRLPKNFKELFDMEAGLTHKEFQEGKRFLPRKTVRKTTKTVDFSSGMQQEESPVPRKEDVAGWRNYQKDKTRAKRARRKNLGSGKEFE